MNIVQYLISLGYKPYRWSEKSYVPCTNNFDFSTMRIGGLDVRLVKDNSEFIFGLNEAGKPPTLISPRTEYLRSDNKMNNYLRNNSSEVVFKELYSFSL